ncbi:MAG: hypothetical protein R3F62_17710 [Planctomycetota bacterium]
MLCVASVGAQERWTLRGEHGTRGPFTSRLTLERTAHEELRVEREVHYLRDGGTEHRAGLVHRRHGDAYTATLEPQGSLRGGLLGETPQPAELNFKLSEDRARIQSLCYAADGTSSASGERDQDLDHLPQRNGRLLAVSENAVQDVLDGGPELGAGVTVANFLHVGGWKRAQILDWIELTPDQRQALAQAERPSVWVRSFVRGEIKLPFRIPVAPLGPATLSVGVEPGTRFRYEILELLPLPEDGQSILSALKVLSFRTFDLPLTAPEALALGLGEERIVEGRFEVALNGRLSLGHALTREERLVRIGATARTEGFYRIKRHWQLSAIRLPGDAVRLELSRGKGRERAVEAKLFSGLSLGRHAPEDEDDEDRIDYLEPVADAGLSVGGALLDGLLKIELKAEDKRWTGDEVSFAYRLDLARPEAREAYERAVRGDLRALQALAQDPQSGVAVEYSINEHEQRVFRQAQAKVFQLFEAHNKRTVSSKEFDVEDAQGSRKFEVFRYRKQSKVGIPFDPFRTERKVQVEAVRAFAEGEEPALIGRSLRYRLDLRDPLTRERELASLQRVLTAWGVPGSEDDPEPIETAPDPRKGPLRWVRTRHGRTRTLLAVDLAEEGIGAILASNAETRRAAYLEADRVVHGEAREEAEAGADRFVRSLARLDRARNAGARDEALRELLELAGYDLQAITALIQLAPKDALQIRAEVGGKRVDYDGELHGRAYTPLDAQTERYGH